jgi:hypothetical protein
MKDLKANPNDKYTNLSILENETKFFLILNFQ